MAAIAKKETAKAALLEKKKEEVAQSKLETHQGKDGKEKEIAKEEYAKAPVITTEAVAKVARRAKGQEEKGNSDQELQKKEEEQKQAL